MNDFITVVHYIWKTSSFQPFNRKRTPLITIDFILHGTLILIRMTTLILLSLFAIPLCIYVIDYVHLPLLGGWSWNHGQLSGIWAVFYSGVKSSREFRWCTILRVLVCHLVVATTGLVCRQMLLPWLFVFEIVKSNLILHQKIGLLSPMITSI